MEALGLAITMRRVVKRYGELVAVDQLDFDVRIGICLGLLGPNGAGKTTTMRLLTGQARADSGELFVLNHHIPKESKLARARMGVVPQRDNLDEELTVRQNIEIFASLYRVPRAERVKAVDGALERAHLTERQHSRVSDLSGGMRRRLLISRGMVHSPELVLLDEPTVGLDPQVRSELWGTIADFRKSGVTSVMSTHYIEEAERLADEVALMSHGNIVARGTPNSLITEYAGHTVVEYCGARDRLEGIERLGALHGLPTRRTGPSVSVMHAERIAPSLADRLGIGVTRAPTLEDVFVLVIGDSNDQ